MSPDQKENIQKTNKERLSFADAMEKLFPTFFDKKDIFKKPKEEVEEIIKKLPEKDRTLANTIYNKGKAVKESLDQIVLPIKGENKKTLIESDEPKDELVKDLETNTNIQKLEKLREEEIQQMLEKKAVKITPNDFEFGIFGCPLGQSISDSLRKENLVIYENTYGNLDKYNKAFSLNRRQGKIIYMYMLTKILSNGRLRDFNGRSGSYVGFSLEFNDIYCTNLQDMEKLFENILDVAIRKYNLLSIQEYKFNISTMNDPQVIDFINWIKKEILDDFNDLSLKNCFRKSDPKLNKILPEGKGYFLHKILEDDKEKKLQNYNLFDFDRNEINARYDKLIQEEKAR